MAILKAARDGQNLRRVITYVLRKDKTQPDLIGGWNVDPENTYAEMMATKRFYGKTDGRAYKHYVQSFHPDDGITAEEAHEIAAEFVARCPVFADFEVLYVTHNDRGHIHTHIICNSVRIGDGPKLDCPRSVLEEMKHLSDQIVREHGYRLEHERHETDNVTAWDRDLYQILSAAHDGRMSSWMYDTAMAVQDAMEHAEDQAGFIGEMEMRGYSVRWGNRSITYMDSDGHKVRSSRLEDVFKLESVRGRYADRETGQQQLRDDLNKSSIKASRSTNDIVSDIEYSAFDVDLRNIPNTISDEETERHFYEAACAVCRQLRNARTADEFYQGMSQGGFRASYDRTARDYMIRTPFGNEISAHVLEDYYDLPSVRQAVIQLHRRPYSKPPQWDGRLWPVYTESGKAHDETSVSNDGGQSISGWNAIRTAGGSRGAAGSARVYMYIYPGSQMWDYELNAAALVLGEGVCDPDKLDELLKVHGYKIVTGRDVTYLLTPRGRRIVIDDTPPQSIPDHGPVKRGIFTAAFRYHMRYAYSGPMYPYSSDRYKSASALANLTVAALLGTAALIELIARLTMHGIHVIRQHHREKVIYKLAVQKVSVNLDDVLKRTGIKPKFAERVPTAEDKGFGQEKHSSEPVMMQQSSNAVPSDEDKLAELLGIVQKALTATDKETFEELLREQNCSTRWTKNGTLTFILPDGTHIRSSRFEKRFRLSSIVQAYGQERRIPQNGVRYDAAQAVEQAARSGYSRQAFEKRLIEAGYRIDWRNGGADATITEPGGQRMRLSSLIRTFHLDTAGEILEDNKRSTSWEQSGSNYSRRMNLLRDIAEAQNELRRSRQGHSSSHRDDFER